LHSIVITVAEAVEQGLRYAAEWKGYDPKQVKFKVNPEFVTPVVDAQVLAELLKGVMAGTISADTYWQYLTLSETFVPFELEWGQVRLAVELYAAEQGFQIQEPTHCNEPNGRRTRLNRDTPGLRMRPPPYAPSRTQFADHLVMRGLQLVR
jgi:hypothetical protein